MKNLFKGNRDDAKYREELDNRSILDMDEKNLKKERLPGGKDNINAFLGEGTVFKGSLTFEGTVRIDGKLEGEIFTKDTLVVGESSKVEATIRAGNLIVSGTVHGNVTAERKVELHSSARLYGNISTPSLTIAEGVVFEGSCTMGKKQEQPGKKVLEKAPPVPLQKIVNK